MQHHLGQSSLDLFNPIEDIMALHVKTLQSLSYVTPTELTKLNHPEVLLEKNIDLFVENGHKLLDYMHQIFLINESHWLSLSHNVERNTKRVINKTQNSSMNAIQEVAKATQKVARKAGSTAKSAKRTLSSTQGIASPEKFSSWPE